MLATDTRNGAILLLFALSLFVSACGGGSGGSKTSSRASSSSVSPPPPLIIHALTTETIGKGGITPANAHVTAGKTQTFTLTPVAGHKIDSVSGCAGKLSNQTFTTEVIGAACNLKVTFVAIEYALTGKVSGLNLAGLTGTLVVSLTVGDETESLSLSHNGVFNFAHSLTTGQGYQVSVSTQPDAQTCELSDNFGEVSAADPSAIIVSCIANNVTASVSGKISPTAGILVDTTLNDRLANYIDNSDPDTPQVINNRATLHGFASAEGTGGNSDEERFSATYNEDDYYRVTLQAGQVIQLQVVDYNGFNVDSVYQGDLDLYLFSLQEDLLDYSNSRTEYEEIVVPQDGEYLINVYAYEGISKYVLRILPVSHAKLAAVSPAEFVPHEMIVQFKQTPAHADHSQLGNKSASQSGTQQVSQQIIPLITQLGNIASFSHTDTNRPTLIKTQPQILQFAPNHAGSTKSRANGAVSASVVASTSVSVASSASLEKLRKLNPAVYDQILTLRNIKAMSQQADVLFAEPNYRRYPQRVPNDPGYINQWHYQAINLPQAWDITTGTKPVGQEVIVAVIDTGVYLQHPDLAGQLVSGYDFIASRNSAADGDGIDANPDDPGDSDARGQSSWHGTHVAGTIAAASNNKLGVAGIAWGARIMPIRVLGRESGTSYDVTQGLRYAAGLSNDSGTLPARRADIANLSLGGGGGSLAERNAYAQARAAGLIIVAAAGNDGNSAPSYPAAYESVISVSATDYRNQKAPYSNYGSSITLAAPGGDVTSDLNGDGYEDGVLSLLVDDSSGSRQPVYGFYQGTSMAAPHVAGVLALMKAIYPALTPAQVDNLIQTGMLSDDLGALGRDDHFGYGLINALKAVRIAADLAAGAPLPAWPAQLRLSPSSLNLSLAAEAEVVLSNQGGGDPQVSSVVSDSPWLSVKATKIDSAGLGGYRITATRTGLKDGYYQGRVTFTTYTQGTLLLEVNMQVGNLAGAGQLTQMYVLLVDPVSQDTIKEVISVATSPNQLNYAFKDVPIGDYILMAGSDIDVDYFICQSGEVCGAYPSLALRQVISVKGVDLTGVDLVADILGNFANANANANANPSMEASSATSGVKSVVPQTTGYGVRRLGKR